MFLRFYAAELISPLCCPQKSTQAGWLRSWTQTSWWRPGRDEAMSCHLTARCPNTPWTSRGSSSSPQSSSSLITTTPNGVFHDSTRTRWPVWGTWTGRGLSCGEAEGWSAPTTLWFSKPSDSWWIGTLAARQREWLGFECDFCGLIAKKDFVGVTTDRTSNKQVLTFELSTLSSETAISSFPSWFKFKGCCRNFRSLKVSNYYWIFYKTQHTNPCTLLWSQYINFKKKK